LLLLDLDLCSFSLSDSFLVTALLASFHANSYGGKVHPFGRVPSVREFRVVFSLTEDAISLAVSHFPD